jgi:capsular polysaccharide biosynthesis protein
MYQMPSTTLARPVDQQERDPLMQFARRWWWLLAIGAIIGIAAAVTYSRTGPIPYESTALMQVVTPSGATTTEQADQARTAAANFAAEVASPRIYTLTSQALVGQLDITASDLEAMERAGTLVIAPMRTSNFIRIVVTDPDPDRAKLIADTISQVFVNDIGVRTKASYEARQAQVNDQIEFTRDQLATSALRQREIDLKESIRDQQSALLTLQTSYQQELSRQAESDAIGDRSSFSENELTQQAEVRTQLLRAFSQQIADAEANITAINEDLTSVRNQLATLPPDTDGSLSAAFSTAYSLQLTALTQRYVTDQIAALTESPPVLRYGEASTPYSTQGIKKIGLFGLMGGMAVAAAFGLAFDFLRKWRAARAIRRGEVPGTGALVPDFERLLGLVDELAGRGDFAGGRAAGSSVRRADNPTPAGD